MTPVDAFLAFMPPCVRVFCTSSLIDKGDINRKPSPSRNRGERQLLNDEVPV